MNGFVSPRLGIRFDTSGNQLVITHPDGRPFETFQQLADRAMAAEARTHTQERENDRLRALLRAAGIDPDQPRGDCPTPGVPNLPRGGRLW